jgi:hypothetical protein
MPGNNLGCGFCDSEDSGRISHEEAFGVAAAEIKKKGRRPEGAGVL